MIRVETAWLSGKRCETAGRIEGIEGMSYYRFKNLRCECGHLLLIVPPGFPDELQRALCMEGKVSVFTANRKEAVCPVCTRTHLLPPEEIFDDDRSDWMGRSAGAASRL